MMTPGYSNQQMMMAPAGYANNQQQQQPLNAQQLMTMPTTQPMMMMAPSQVKPVTPIPPVKSSVIQVESSTPALLAQAVAIPIQPTPVTPEAAEPSNVVEPSTQ